ARFLTLLYGRTSLPFRQMGERERRHSLPSGGMHLSSVPKALPTAGTRVVAPAGGAGRVARGELAWGLRLRQGGAGRDPLLQPLDPKTIDRCVLLVPVTHPPTKGLGITGPSANTAGRATGDRNSWVSCRRAAGPMHPAASALATCRCLGS